MNINFPPAPIPGGNPYIVTDNVNKPMHYQGNSNLECIDAIRACLSKEEYEGFLRGNMLKYIWRFRQKGGAESLRKSNWYYKKLMESLGETP